MSSPLQAPSLQTVEAAARRLLTAPGVDLSVATVRTVRHALEGQFGVSLTTTAEQKASVKAALKFKYKPRVVDGEAIEVAGVQNKFTYELEQ